MVGERERQQVTSPWAGDLAEATGSQTGVVGNPNGHLVWSARERGEREATGYEPLDLSVGTIQVQGARGSYRKRLSVQKNLVMKFTTQHDLD